MSTVEENPIKRRTITLAQFAEAIGVSRATVYALIADGKVKFINNPRGGKRFLIEEVDDYLRRNLADYSKSAPAPAPARRRKKSAPPGTSIAADGKSRLRVRGS